LTRALVAIHGIADVLTAWVLRWNTCAAETTLAAKLNALGQLCYGMREWAALGCCCGCRVRSSAWCAGWCRAERDGKIFP
jgi:hypothetical protein